MNRLGSFIVLATIFAAASANLAGNVTQCGTTPIPTEIFVDGCEAVPCRVANGDTVNFRFAFEPPRFSTTLTAGVSLRIGPLAIPFTLTDEQRNACNGLVDTQCPVFGGVSIWYGLGMLVEAPVTGVTVTLEFHLEDDTGARATCFMYDQQIV